MNVLNIILATTKHISFLWVKKQLITYEKYKTTLKEIGILAMTYKVCCTELLLLCFQFYDTLFIYFYFLEIWSYI